jgi:hypothetical protein
VKSQTIAVALLQEHCQALKQATEKWHHVQRILQRMQALSREVILSGLPYPL